MKTIYINENLKLTKRKIRKIAKKIYKKSKKEELVVALCKTLNQNKELIEEIKGYKIEILNRKMAF